MVNLFLPNKTSPDATLTIFLTEDKIMHCRINNKSFEVNLKEYLESAESKISNHTTFDTQKLDSQNQKPNLRELCTDIAHKLGFNYSKGTYFIIEAVLYLYENNIDSVNLTEVYQALEKKFCINYPKIRDWIRKSIREVANELTNEKYQKYVVPFRQNSPITAKFVIVQATYDLRKKYPPAQYSKERIKKILYSLG